MPEPPSFSGLRKRFPALGRLKLGRRARRIPFVQQMEDLVRDRRTPLGTACVGTATPACAAPLFANASEMPRVGASTFALRGSGLRARAVAVLALAVGVDPIGDGELYIRVVTPVFADSTSDPNSVLQALYPIATRSNDLAESVQSSYQKYRQLVFLRQPLKISSIVALSLALLLSVLMAVWFALYSARRMMVPVHDLVEGTRAVAEGVSRLAHRHP